MSNSLAVLNQQMVSDLDSLADSWKAVDSATAEPPRAPAKRKRGPSKRRASKPTAVSR